MGKAMDKSTSISPRAPLASLLSGHELKIGMSKWTGKVVAFLKVGKETVNGEQRSDGETMCCFFAPCDSRGESHGIDHVLRLW